MTHQLSLIWKSAEAAHEPLDQRLGNFGPLRCTQNIEMAYGVIKRLYCYVLPGGFAK